MRCLGIFGAESGSVAAAFRLVVKLDLAWFDILCVAFKKSCRLKIDAVSRHFWRRIAESQLAPSPPPSVFRLVVKLDLACFDILRVAFKKSCRLQ